MALLVITGCAQRWQRYTSDAGRFSVLVPGVPTCNEEVLHPAGIPISLRKLNLIIDNEAVGYSVMYADYPSRIVDAVRPGQLLAFAVTGATKIAGSRVIGRRQIHLGRYPGREITILDSHGLIYRNRCYMVNRRLYQVIAATRREAAASQDVYRFLDSFQLLNGGSNSRELDGPAGTGRPSARVMGAAG